MIELLPEVLYLSCEKLITLVKQLLCKCNLRNLNMATIAGEAGYLLLVII